MNHLTTVTFTGNADTRSPFTSNHVSGNHDVSNLVLVILLVNNHETSKFVYSLILILVALILVMPYKLS